MNFISTRMRVAIIPGINLNIPWIFSFLYHFPGFFSFPSLWKQSNPFLNLDNCSSNFEKWMRHFMLGSLASPRNFILVPRAHRHSVFCQNTIRELKHRTSVMSQTSTGSLKNQIMHTAHVIAFSRSSRRRQNASFEVQGRTRSSLDV